MQFSIGKLMFLVAISGVDCLLISKIGGPPSAYGVEKNFGELIVIGGLPMMNLLALLTLLRKPGRPGRDAFLVGGLVALGLYLAVASVAAEAISSVLLNLLEPIAPRGDTLFSARTGWRLICIELINILPQVALGALIGRAIRRRRDRDPDSTPLA